MCRPCCGRPRRRCTTRSMRCWCCSPSSASSPPMPGVSRCRGRPPISASSTCRNSWSPTPTSPASCRPCTRSAAGASWCCWCCMSAARSTTRPSAGTAPCCGWCEPPITCCVAATGPSERLLRLLEDAGEEARLLRRGLCLGGFFSLGALGGGVLLLVGEPFFQAQPGLGGPLRLIGALGLGHLALIHGNLSDGGDVAEAVAAGKPEGSRG